MFPGDMTSSLTVWDIYETELILASSGNWGLLKVTIGSTGSHIVMHWWDVVQLA